MFSLSLFDRSMFWSYQKKKKIALGSHIVVCIWDGIQRGDSRGSGFQNGGTEVGGKGSGMEMRGAMEGMQTYRKVT